MNKLHMGMKRMLTGVLAAAMIVTSVPAYAFAEEIQAGDDTAVIAARNVHKSVCHALELCRAMRKRAMFR